MEVTQRIDRSFADEHVIGCDPPLRPDLPNVWRRRMHPFAGRAVSDKALTAEQDVRSGMQRLYGLSLAPGSVSGLEVTAEPGAIGAAPEVAQLIVSPGIAIAVSGEDVSIGSARRVKLADLPVILMRSRTTRIPMCWPFRRRWGAIGCGRCCRAALAATSAGSPRVRAVRYCRMSRCSSRGR